MSGPVWPRIQVEAVPIGDGDLVLLCTNGLTDSVADSMIAVARYYVPA